MKSYIADNIMREYKKKKRVKVNKQRSELENFIKENCKDCINKNTDLCHITRNIKGQLQCVFKEI